MPVVTVRSPSAIKVQVNRQQSESIRSLSYSPSHTIKSSTDLDMSHAGNGDSIIYNSNTKSFVVSPVTINTSEIIDVKGGTF